MVIEIRTLMVGSAMFHDRLVQTGWQGELNGWLREVDNEGGLEITRGDRYRSWNVRSMRDAKIQSSSGSPGGDKKMLFDLQKYVSSHASQELKTNPKKQNTHVPK